MIFSLFTVGPNDLEISGPSSVQTRDTVSVTCHTSPSVPPAQVSWIVSQNVKHLESSETVHQEPDASFVTMTTMSLYVPDESAGEDIVVQCVARHETLEDDNIAAVHIIRVEGIKS